MDDRGEDSAVESLPLLNSTTFVQGEKVLASLGGRIHEAKGVKNIPYEWLGIDRLMKHTKENLQKQKTLEKEHLKNPNATIGQKRKTTSNDGPSEPTIVPLEGASVSSKAAVGPTASWGMTNDGNLLDTDKARDSITRTKARLSDLPKTELVKNVRCTALENFAHMEEMAKRYHALLAKETALTEELMRCKTTITSQVKDIAVAADVAAGLRKELEKVRLERGDVIKEATRAEAARMQAEVARAKAEAETSALRAGRLELLGRVSEAEGAKMRAEGQAAALKAENDELLKKLAEAEAANKNFNKADEDVDLLLQEVLYNEYVLAKKRGAI